MQHRPDPKLSDVCTAADVCVCVRVCVRTVVRALDQNKLEARRCRRCPSLGRVVGDRVIVCRWR
jgi:hypothetical protein